MYNLPSDIKSHTLEYLIDEPKIQRLKNNNKFRKYINSRLHKYRIDIEGDTTSFNIWNLKSYDKKAFRYIHFIEDKIKDKLKYGYIVYLDIYVGASFFYIPDNKDVDIFVKSSKNFEIKNWDDFIKEFEEFINKPDDMPDVSNVHYTDITFKYYYSNYDTFKYKLYCKIKKNLLVINKYIKYLVYLLIKSMKRYKDLN